MNEIKNENYKYDGMTIHCPYCGEKIVVEFDTAKCEECEWSAIETDLYEIMDC